MGQRNSGVVHKHQGGFITETIQGKDREGGLPVSLDGRKEGHKNLSYWEQVDRARSIVPVRHQRLMNRGTRTYLIPNKCGAPQKIKGGIPEPELTQLWVSQAPKT